MGIAVAVASGCAKFVWASATAPICLSKSEAITIGHLALLEQITDQPGIWTHLSKNIRSKRPKGNDPSQKGEERNASPCGQ